MCSARSLGIEASSLGFESKLRHLKQCDLGHLPHLAELFMHKIGATLPIHKVLGVIGVK